MSNPIKREYDKLSLAKDIAERENIVYQFQMTGFLDRKRRKYAIRNCKK